MSGPHVLSVDLGSSSVRAAVYSGTGRPLPGSECRAAHRLRLVARAAELDPDDSLERVCRAVDGALAAARAAGVTVEAVAMAAMWHGVCGIDRSGGVTVPILTWADQRSAAAAARLRQRVDDAGQHTRTGARLHSSYLPAKLAWLAEEFPDRVAATARWSSPAEFVHLRLFGEATASVSMASGTGLFDQHTCDWDAELLAAVAVDQQRLSRVSDEPARGLLPVFRSRWPELAEVPWYPGIGDGAASNVGTGCVDTGRLGVTIGTSAALRVLFPARRLTIPDDLWCYRLDADHPVVGGALSDGGGLVAWLRDVLVLPDVDTTEERVAAAEPGAHGLNVLPLLSGERSTGWHDLATGAITGLTLGTGPLDILRASMEAVALRLAVLAGILRRALPGDREAVASGAALESSPAWRQIVADALGLPMHDSTVREASTRGAALWALRRLGAIPSLAMPTPLAKVTRPDPHRHDTYLRLMARQQGLYDLLVDPS